jgi:hypothetical protein
VNARRAPQRVGSRHLGDECSNLLINGPVTAWSTSRASASRSATRRLGEPARTRAREPRWCGTLDIRRPAVGRELTRVDPVADIRVNLGEVPREFTERSTVGIRPELVLRGRQGAQKPDGISASWSHVFKNISSSLIIAFSCCRSSLWWKRLLDEDSLVVVQAQIPVRISWRHRGDTTYSVVAKDVAGLE